MTMSVQIFRFSPIFRMQVLTDLIYYRQSGLYGNNSNYNAEDTIGDDYDGDLRPRAVWHPIGI